MKKTIIVATAIAAITGTAAIAGGGSGSNNFSGVSGNFGGSVGSFSKSGGASFTGSYGGNQKMSTRNESGSGQFSGASVQWDSNVSKGGGDVTMGAETFTDGFDFSKTNNKGGFGFSGATRGGMAGAGGSFGGAFGQTKGNFGGSNWDDDDD